MKGEYLSDITDVEKKTTQLDSDNNDSFGLENSSIINKPERRLDTHTYSRVFPIKK